jgi:hypothetical protein
MSSSILLTIFRISLPYYWIKPKLLRRKPTRVESEESGRNAYDLEFPLRGDGAGKAHKDPK